MRLVPTSSSLGRWLVLVPAIAVGAALAVARFAPDRVLAAARCPLRELTGVPCLTCGGTHALVALAQGDVAAAWNWNPVAPIGAALLVGWLLWAVAAAAVPTLRVRPVAGPREARALRWVLVGLLVGLWVRQILALR